MHLDDLNLSIVGGKTTVSRLGLEGNVEGQKVFREWIAAGVPTGIFSLSSWQVDARTQAQQHHQTRANQIERSRAEGVQRIIEDVVLTNLEVRKIESLQVGDIDVCGHDLAAHSDPLG